MPVLSVQHLLSCQAVGWESLELRMCELHEQPVDCVSCWGPFSGNICCLCHHHHHPVFVIVTLGWVTNVLLQHHPLFSRMRGKPNASRTSDACSLFAFCFCIFGRHLATDTAVTFRSRCVWREERHGQLCIRIVLRQKNVTQAVTEWQYRVTKILLLICVFWFK